MTAPNPLPREREKRQGRFHEVRGGESPQARGGGATAPLLRAKRATQNDKLSAYYFGQLAELRVILSLLFRGYLIRGWRVKTPVGEIDIVAEKRKTLIILEVKARKSHDTARASLSPHQQDRLKRATGYLLSTRPRLANHAIRFDCCTVSWYMRVQHVINAFD